MTTINALEIKDVKEKIVAIVHFGPAGFQHDGMKPGEYYQVTIDPGHISPSGRFIRFGGTPGDEIIGWQRSEALTIVEVLGSWAQDAEAPLLQYGDAGLVKFMIAEKVEVK